MHCVALGAENQKVSMLFFNDTKNLVACVALFNAFGDVAQRRELIPRHSLRFARSLRRGVNVPGLSQADDDDLRSLRPGHCEGEPNVRTAVRAEVQCADDSTIPLAP